MDSLFKCIHEPGASLHSSIAGWVGDIVHEWSLHGTHSIEGIVYSLCDYGIRIFVIFAEEGVETAAFVPLGVNASEIDILDGNDVVVEVGNGIFAVR